MAKRGYKLQEFVAHSTAVNCLSIGKKARRLFITGGEDQKVNLWAIGKPTSLMSLCGHTSPVESLSFDVAEILVASGASSGAIKLWDLEEAKMVRTLTGHRSNCTAVEFHPFGEFFASGSVDTNLRIWDIRKKGCIHTYKGHTQGISTIRFTPDGRWVVSGGFDNIVKVWDLTAGKLLHDFKFHEGHIRSLDFHPLEFLLATGSADRTVKFWDLETFELIGSTRTEASGVHAISFHPDGRTLFCGLDDCLKVLSWEPVICHDSINMGWSTLGDLCIHEGKLLGCSYHGNTVGVWVADISLIEPYGIGVVPDTNENPEQKFDVGKIHLEKVGIGIKSCSSLRSKSPDNETSAEKSHTSQRIGPYSFPRVGTPLESKEISNRPSIKQGPAVGGHAKTGGSMVGSGRSFVVPSVVPREDFNETNSSRESITATAKASGGTLSKPSHVRRPSIGKYDVGRLSMSAESQPITYLKSEKDGTMDANFHARLMAEQATDSCDDKRHDIKGISEKYDKVLSPKLPCSQENGDEFVNSNKPLSSVKIVNGVAIVRGRTRSLVERFERRDILSSDEDRPSDASPKPVAEAVKTPPTLKVHHQTPEKEVTMASDEKITEGLMQNHDVFLSNLRSRLTKLQVVRHFWERNDIKGALNAITKLPDHSVQVDVAAVLMEKMELVTLDIFSCLLPVLIGLLDSKIERHASLSLEFLLKLVAVFGPVVHSTISAPRVVGVDLHAEERLECCNQCFIQLQKIQKILPLLVRRGGLLAKGAQELNLVLQQS
ncbi:Katanin p80 subunit, C-terminal [Dillenia turbinata]|uniref:Katanin p80 WD40 repeat-containing subunit B1 homolog n=1 Tax=Dillenia turbinata TaxID=194707 RepID=A0AAN8ZC75_9MAGN